MSHISLAAPTSQALPSLTLTCTLNLLSSTLYHESPSYPELLGKDDEDFSAQFMSLLAVQALV